MRLKKLKKSKCKKVYLEVRSILSIEVYSQESGLRLRSHSSCWSAPVPHWKRVARYQLEWSDPLPPPICSKPRSGLMADLAVQIAAGPQYSQEKVPVSLGTFKARTLLRLKGPRPVGHMWPYGWALLEQPDVALAAHVITPWALLSQFPNFSLLT